MRSFLIPEIHQIFCRLKCYNNVYKYNIFNPCRCHPECRQLNYDPCLTSKNYPLLYNKRDCDCLDNSCKLIYPHSIINPK